MSNQPDSLPTGDALAGVVIPAGCTCTTKANDMAAFTQSAICDAELEQIIEESDARWTEDMFHVHGGELMDMLRKAAALRSRQQVAEGFERIAWQRVGADGTPLPIFVSLGENLSPVCNYRDVFAASKGEK